MKKLEKDMKELLLNKGYKIWEKKDENGTVVKCRIYINDLVPLMEEMGHPNPKFFRNYGMYFDVLEDAFYYNRAHLGSSRTKGVKELIAYLRNEVKNELH